MAFSLADRADAVSLSHFTDEDLTTVHKADGTPVSQVDFDTEQAVLDVLRRECPADAVVGEEVGPQPGNAARRWILDGIDGTHNFAFGRPGWATAIALEVDGEIVLGLLSAPALGRRWWAVKGEGHGRPASPPAVPSTLRLPSRSTWGRRHCWPRRASWSSRRRDSSSVGATS